MTSEVLNVLDLFAGIGGASYAGKLIGGWQTVCYVEWDKYCQQVIQARIRDGIFDDAPIWDDVQTFDGKPWRGSVDIITAGFPCQPFSVAGKQQGESDERNMWPDTCRVISEVRPRYAFLENVPALLTSGYFGRIIGDLSEIGYDCRWTIVSARHLGALHLRERVWIQATDTTKEGIMREQPKEVSGFKGFSWCATIGGIEDMRNRPDVQQPLTVRTGDGPPDRSNRLEALGNSWVPAVAATAWRILTGGHATTRQLTRTRYLSDIARIWSMTCLRRRNDR